MFPIRVKTVQESDLRMLGSLARNIQRVLPVTQADIDAAAALGKGWVVWKVFEVSDPLDNLRGGTQLVIRQNSIQPGQNVRRVIFVVGPGGQTVVIRGTDYIVLPDAIADSLTYVKAFGGTYQGNIPQEYTQVNYVTNTAQTAVDTGIMIDFAKNYEFEVECRAVSGSWYILQSRASSSGNITGISGANSGSTITLVVGNVTVCTSAITRTVGNKLYVKATLNAGTATLYVKDETANTEDTQTGSYGTSQPNPTAAVYLLGNAGGQYVDVNSDIYMARIKENGVTVMDYVPARQVATAGFYDKASGTFKTAKTPANLSADGNTVPTPDAPIDIVCNNGVLKVSPNLFDVSQTIVSSRDDVVSALLTQPSIYNRANCSSSSVGQIIPMGNTTSSVALLFTLGDSYTVRAFVSLGTLARYSWATTDENNVIIERGSYSYGSPITPTLDAKYIYIQFGASLSSEQLGGCMLVKGTTDPTEYMPYGKAYTDGTVEKVEVVGKNLLDMTKLTPSKYINASGVITNGGYGYSDLILVVSGAKYTFSATYTDTVTSTRIHGYKDGVWQQQIFGGTAAQFPKTITIPAGVNQVRISFYPQPTNPQLEVGETATTYEPYFNGGTATAEMLLGTGDCIDEQNITTGAISRNVGIKVFDGSETWQYDSNYTRFVYAILDVKKYGQPRRTPYILTHFGVAKNGETAGQIPNNTAYGYTNSTAMYIKTTDFSDTTTWKNWLAAQYAAGTPVIVVYPLATATTETVTPQPLQVTNGDNIVEITQAGMDGLELEVQYNAAVSLTIQEVQDANLDNNVTVTIQ